jgi:hypothetical protein
MDRTGAAQRDYRATRSNKCAPVSGRESWAAGSGCFVCLPCLPWRWHALGSTGQVQRRIPYCTAGVAANPISSVCTRDTWGPLGNNCVARLMSPARGWWFGLTEETGPGRLVGLVSALKETKKKSRQTSDGTVPINVSPDPCKAWHLHQERDPQWVS